MRILYLSQSYVPSRSASSIQVMRMCAALARNGHRVELVTKLCPSRCEAGVEDDLAYYGVEGEFERTKLSRPALRGGGLLYALQVARHLRRRRREVDLVYSRDAWGAWVASRMRLPVLLEVHGLPSGRLTRRLHRGTIAAPSFRRLVAISRGLLDDLAAAGLVPPRAAASLVAHDAAEPNVAPVVATAHGDDGRNAPRVGYVGHLYAGRGLEVIAALAERLPGVCFEVVGGDDASVADWRRRTTLDNLRFHGFVPPGRLAELYARFDVLLMPYQRAVLVRSGRTDTSAWMSPLKMFEYMSTGRPIVASNLPVLREVLEDGRNALLAPPDDVTAWETALRRLLSDDALRARLGRAARDDVLREHTWSARAARVLDGL